MKSRKLSTDTTGVPGLDSGSLPVPTGTPQNDPSSFSMAENNTESKATTTTITEDTESSGLSDEEMSMMDIDSTSIKNFANREQLSPYLDKDEIDEKGIRSSLQAIDLNSEKRLFLIREINRLKIEVYNATIKGIGSDEGSDEAKRLTTMTIKLEKAEKSFKLLFAEENTLVPDETPYFQWKGQVFNKRRPVFLHVEDCLDHFERVLFAHRLSVEDNWRRLVPARLSTTMAKWYAIQIQKHGFKSWSDFKAKVLTKYGRNQADMKDKAREKLEQMLYKTHTPIDKFIDEFQELKNLAEIQDEDCLVRYLFKALPEELVQATKFYINNAAEKEDLNIDFVISKVVATYEALFKKKWLREGIYSGNVVFHSNNNKNSKTISRHATDKRHGGESSKLICKYHPGLHNHALKDCLLSPEVKKIIDKAHNKYGSNVKLCNHCRTRFKKGHHCLETVEDMETDEDDDDESKMTFAALSLEDTD
ncbi:hypothetical protein, partial, partial [Parasitella parasitica]